MTTAYPSAERMPSAASEAERARILLDYGILDTGAERAFDDLTALASRLCDAPASIITFIDGDRLWFKSTYGLTAAEAPVEHSFCAHAAGAPGEVFAVEDALGDGRFRENVFVAPADGLRAYAGANIVDEASGVALGSICVVDFEERPFTDAQRDALDRLSRQVVDQLQLRRRLLELDRERRRLHRVTEHAERVAHVLAHDFRGPLLGQRDMVTAITEDYADEIPGEALGLLDLLGQGASRTLDKLGDVMRYLREGNPADAKLSEVRVDELFDALRAHTRLTGGTVLTFENDGVEVVRTRPVALEHILINLLGNAVKYVGREDGRISVHVQREGADVEFCVSDNGPGIPDGERERVFDLFGRGANAAEDGGSGVGLAMAQRLAHSLGGDIELSDNEGGGCVFTVRIPG